MSRTKPCIHYAAESCLLVWKAHGPCHEGWCSLACVLGEALLGCPDFVLELQAKVLSVPDRWRQVPHPMAVLVHLMYHNCQCSVQFFSNAKNPHRLFLRNNVLLGCTYLSSAHPDFQRCSLVQNHVLGSWGNLLRSYTTELYVLFARWPSCSFAGLLLHPNLMAVAVVEKSSEEKLNGESETEVICFHW